MGECLFHAIPYNYFNVILSLLALGKHPIAHILFIAPITMESSRLVVHKKSEIAVLFYIFAFATLKQKRILLECTDFQTSSAQS
eukprot:snap_masked-scaffold_13-processed-gene-8.31-mRNA-1 protein AED:1.00 eAED:1.00 QI:0/0/0/0/1/1/4/0/83